MKQKQIIQKYLESLNTWVEEYKVRCINTPHGFIGARGDRNVREMIQDGEIEASMQGKYRVVRAKLVKPMRLEL